jgi:uncharacterized protein
MIRPELLEILRCPETHQRLSPATPELVEALNTKIRAGQLQNRSGQIVRDPLEGALVREDQRFAYPIRAQLPIMLITEAIPTS